MTHLAKPRHVQTVAAHLLPRLHSDKDLIILLQFDVWKLLQVATGKDGLMFSLQFIEGDHSPARIHRPGSQILSAQVAQVCWRWPRDFHGPGQASEPP